MRDGVLGTATLAIMRRSSSGGTTARARDREPAHGERRAAQMDDERLGLIVEGSLVDGLRARLDGNQSVEEIRVGQFVRITGQKHDYFCLVTDVRLDATNSDLLADPPQPDDDFALRVLAGTTA